MTSSAPAAKTRRDPLALVEPDDESAAFAERLGHWRDEFGEDDDYSGWVMRRIVVASMRLDRDVAEESSLRAYEAARARLSWSADRRLAAEETAARLAHDPGRVRRRLEATLQGADWLIERWDALARIALANPERGWTGPQRDLALDLLAVPPALRDGPAPFDPAPGDAPGPTQAALAGDERSRLARLRDHVLVSRDDRERELAARGVTVGFSPAMTRLHRHEALWTREFYRAVSEFRRVNRRPAAPAEPAPAHAHAPPPPAAPPSPRETTPGPLPDAAALASCKRMIEKYRSLQSRTEIAEDMRMDDGEADADPDQAARFASTSARSASSAPTGGGNRRARRARRARLRSAG